MKFTRPSSLPLRVIGSTTVILLSIGGVASAPDQHAHHQRGTATAPPPFIASTAKAFPQLMDDAMAVMAYGMTTAPMNGNADHDFVTMMTPHHQGAVDMAKALLLYTKDPELANLAQGIITEQQNEIRLMQAWLARDQAKRTGVVKVPQKQSS